MLNKEKVKPFFLEYNLDNNDTVNTLIQRNYLNNLLINIYEISDSFALKIECSKPGMKTITLQLSESLLMTVEEFYQSLPEYLDDDERIELKKSDFYFKSDG